MRPMHREARTTNSVAKRGRVYVLRRGNNSNRDSERGDEMTWEQDAAAAIRGLKAENERLREENNVLSAREARAENSALHLGALVDELRARLAGSADLAARLAEAHASLAEGDKRYAAENARLQARLAEAEADLRIAFRWGDPFDMTVKDAAVWHRLHAKYNADSAEGGAK